ncbi:MAG: tRNA preQ1(34) S-adenosylmethionine ribosyltransferase-isomerase QueA [Betaproteobacteria bacterium RIFCSPLOWO2_02_FULL_68_150]|nr:MAG: tRNA preQ1(34) S-adenosylmethionine ribosyltransferase-isomerase QueA [Betaproteobacteria bacterium RIFCSPLOWO2_02_FULL_68_150]
MKTSDFDYALPEELIAQHPAAERSASRMLHLDGKTGAFEDLMFAQLPSLVRPNDLVVLNDTRVIKARLFGHKSTGGKTEVFVERIVAEREALVLMRSGHRTRAGTRLTVGDGVGVEVLALENDLYRARFSEPVMAVLERCGNVPLPPYVRHRPDAVDAERYQTVFADKEGAVAAPTAGLHFDRALLERIERGGVRLARVTLHVGSGTFQPLRSEEVEQHRMHSERYDVPQATIDAIEATHAAGGRVLAVGTTALRALESWAQTGECSGETSLFIYPGFEFRVADRLLTNFHLPKSSLLILVSAFGGSENLRRAYAHAIAQRYRFFSYGDAMLIERTR